MTRQRPVVFVVPDSIDDPDRVSGGNVYDRELQRALAERGRIVRMAPVADRVAAIGALGRVRSGELLLIDGLVAGWAPDAVEEAAARTSVVILAHMVSAAFAGATVEALAAEGRALRTAGTVIATSDWTAGELVRLGLVAPTNVAVAVPGSRQAMLSSNADHRSFLCVGAIAPHKGQDVLLEALAFIADEDWTCTLVGSPDVDPAYSATVASMASHLGDRVRMPGTLHGAALDQEYRKAGLFVAPSRVESYGMAIVDARSRGLPIIASAVGGIPEAVVGGGALLVPPGQSRALADALGEWLANTSFRHSLKRDADGGRESTPRWADTAERVDRVLESA